MRLKDEGNAAIAAQDFAAAAKKYDQVRVSFCGDRYERIVDVCVVYGVRRSCMFVSRKTRSK
jgi:hypothetical protein